MSVSTIVPQRNTQAVIIARFQVPELTEAHEFLLNQVVQQYPDYPPIILLGVSRSRMTRRNPLPYEAREQMIRTAFPNVLIAPLADQSDNDTWSANVDTTVSMLATGKPILCGSRDSFIPHYRGRLQVQQIEFSAPTSGTAIREAVGRVCINDKKFRAGIIYGTQNQFHRVDSTVDGIVVNHDLKSVLVGYKTKDKKPGTAVFPGGFLDKNERARDAMKRELLEETGLSIEGSMIILETFVVKDWRYQRENDRNILTHPYLIIGGYIGGAQPNDDLQAVEWVPFDKLCATLTQHHIELWNEYAAEILNWVDLAKAAQSKDKATV